MEYLKLPNLQKQEADWWLPRAQGRVRWTAAVQWSRPSVMKDGKALRSAVQQRAQHVNRLFSTRKLCCGCKNKLSSWQISKGLAVDKLLQRLQGSRCSHTCSWECKTLPSFFFFSLGDTHSVWKFRGQGSNPHQSSDPKLQQ